MQPRRTQLLHTRPQRSTLAEVQPGPAAPRIIVVRAARKPTVAAQVARTAEQQARIIADRVAQHPQTGAVQPPATVVVPLAIEAVQPPVIVVVLLAIGVAQRPVTVAVRPAIEAAQTLATVVVPARIHPQEAETFL